MICFNQSIEQANHLACLTEGLTHKLTSRFNCTKMGLFSSEFEISGDNFVEAKKAGRARTDSGKTRLRKYKE